MPGLTERERQCLTLIARGLTAEQTGEHLNISAKTVKYHLENAYRSLGANNAPAAVARALACGQITFGMINNNIREVAPDKKSTLQD